MWDNQSVCAFRDLRKNGDDSNKIHWQALHRTKNAFDEVSTGIEDSISAVTTISSKMKQIDDARKNVVETVSSLSAIAQENAASTEESSASVSSITSIADEIEESSGDLKNIAEELDDSMRQFRY